MSTHAAWAERGEQTIPNTLYPPRRYTPEPTAKEKLRQQISDERRNRAGLIPFGRPLSPRAVKMFGQPCPHGYTTEHGYNDKGCRCESCRALHRERRLARLRRQRERNTL